MNSGSTSYSQPHPDSTWVTSVDGYWGTFGGQVLSAYYHPTKKHTATTEGKLGQKRSTANAGKWAISIQSKAMWETKLITIHLIDDL